MTASFVSSEVFGRLERGLSKTLPVSLNFVSNFPMASKINRLPIRVSKVKFFRYFAIRPSFSST